MSLTTVPNNAPSFVALSTDVAGSKISGLSYVGASVYLTDTQKSYVVLPDLTLEEVSSTQNPAITQNVVADASNTVGRLGKLIR